jgi:hypothetical protein
MAKSDTLTRVSAGTPKRTVRVEDDLWARYAALCEREGTSCAEDLRAHIERGLTMRRKASLSRF